MGIDEKKILKNLDQYLIRRKPSSLPSTKNGDIQSIFIEDEEVLDSSIGFYKLPIAVSIIFNGKDDLVSFVDNIEKYIIVQKDDRILYKISEVVYDMMAYDQRQEAKLLLEAYYFK